LHNGAKHLVGRPRFVVTDTAPNAPSLTTSVGLELLAPSATLLGDATTKVSGPSGAVLDFSLLPLYGPANGVVVVSANGMFTYTPNVGFSGYDRFFYEVTDGEQKSVGEYVIGVSPSLPTPPLAAPTVAMATKKIDFKFLSFDQKMLMAHYNVSAGPLAQVGDKYRIEILQNAQDCDLSNLTHAMCFDLVVVNCG
jgi:hypothetical protein